MATKFQHHLLNHPTPRPISFQIFIVMFFIKSKSTYIRLNIFNYLQYNEKV